LAARLDWSPATLASYETGRRGLRVAQLSDVAKALHLPPAALLTTEDHAVDVLRRLNTDVERWGQVSLFLDALEMDNEDANMVRR
jgi:transcriptional regulator with XRE-family HTH domain